MKTLPREPYRGGQICGEHLQYGVVPGRSVFCGEHKSHLSYFCVVHAWELARDGDDPSVGMAEGNLLGDVRIPAELQWEGEDGKPVAATPEEIKAWLTSATTAEGSADTQ